MTRLLLLTTTILVTITLLPSPTVQTQQPEKDQFPKPHNPEIDQFPKPETYPQAGANCKVKRRLEPWLGMPDAGPGKSRCVLSFYNCQTDKTDVYRSAPRESGTVSLDCSDYQRAMEALGSIEICCDPKCEKLATPWFDRGRPGYSGPECKNRQPIQTTIDTKGFVFLYMCGLPVFVHDAKKEKSPRYGWGTNIEAYERALRSHVTEKVGPYVCCDSFNASARPGSSCDPRFDLDCDGSSNGTDLTEDGRFPEITTFAVGPGIPIKDTVPHLSCFIPPSPNECDCKWELMQGTRQRSRDRRYYDYEGRWRCPSTGKEIVVHHSAFETYPCGPVGRN